MRRRLSGWCPTGALRPFFTRDTDSLHQQGPTTTGTSQGDRIPSRDPPPQVLGGSVWPLRQIPKCPLPSADSEDVHTTESKSLTPKPRVSPVSLRVQAWLRNTRACDSPVRRSFYPPSQKCSMHLVLLHHMHNTIQYHTIQYNAIQCNTMQYNAIHYSTMQMTKSHGCVHTSMPAIADMRAPTSRPILELTFFTCTGCSIFKEQAALNSPCASQL